jgi:hypothetical protein
VIRLHYIFYVLLHVKFKSLRRVISKTELKVQFSLQFSAFVKKEQM